MHASIDAALLQFLSATIALVSTHHAPCYRMCTFCAMAAARSSAPSSAIDSSPPSSSPSPSPPSNSSSSSRRVLLQRAQRGQLPGLAENVLPAMHHASCSDARLEIPLSSTQNCFDALLDLHYSNAQTRSASMVLWFRSQPCSGPSLASVCPDSPRMPRFTTHAGKSPICYWVTCPHSEAYALAMCVVSTVFISKLSSSGVLKGVARLEVRHAVLGDLVVVQLQFLQPLGARHCARQRHRAHPPDLCMQIR